MVDTVLPIVALLAGLALTGGILSAGRAYTSVEQTNKQTSISDVYNSYLNDFYRGKMNENTDYWTRYIYAHGLEGRQIRYPYRTGYLFNQSGLIGSAGSLASNDLQRHYAMVNGLLGVGGSVNRTATTLTHLYG